MTVQTQRCPVASPAKDALAWPVLPGRSCDGDHAQPQPAVLTGVVTGRMIGRGYVDGAHVALCLDCAALHHDELTPDPLPSCPSATPVVPDTSELDNYRKLLTWLGQSDAERIAATGKKRSNGPLTPQEYELGMVTGLPRPMVEVPIGEHYLTARAIETHDFPVDEYGDVEATKRLPAPWINGWHSAVDGDFYSFRDDLQSAHDERLCCICGDAMLGSVAVAAAYGKKQTSGGWGHPRCVTLSVRTCPHFTDPFPVEPGSDEPRYAIVAWRWDGDGVGVDRPGFEAEDPVSEGAVPLSWAELRAWAAEEPWG